MKKTLFEDFFDFFKGLDRRVKVAIAGSGMQSWSQGLSSQYNQLYAEGLGAGYVEIGWLNSIGAAIVSTLLQIPAGRLADRIGRKKVFLLLRPLTYLGTFLMILAPRPEHLILVGLLGAVGMRGGAGGVSFTPFITMHWEMVPGEKMGRWFGVEGLMSLSTIPATILGGVLWQYGFMREVLLLPIALEVLFVIPILMTIPDTLGRNDR